MKPIVAFVSPLDHRLIVGTLWNNPAKDLWVILELGGEFSTQNLEHVKEVAVFRLKEDGSYANPLVYLGYELKHHFQLEVIS